MGRQVVVIGGGPGGYVAAIRAAQLGADVILIEKNQLGGTCLNVGCIPTKALLHAAQLAQEAKEASDCGICLTLDRIDWAGVLSYKDSVVNRLVSGVESLMRANRIRVIRGTARFIKPKTLEITTPDQPSSILEADRIIIATGAAPVIPPIAGLRESSHLLDSTKALCCEQMPASMVILGGGVIGVELACAFQALGCRVTIVEALPRLASNLDAEMSDLLYKSLSEQGIDLLLGHSVTGVCDQENGVAVTVTSNQEEKTLLAERLLVAVGRRPQLESLDLSAGGIKTEQGRLLVNEQLETNIPGVYAIGDCLGQVMLAHTASAQGEIAAENALGQHKEYRPACIPSGIYGIVEAAGVGLTEEQANEQNIAYHVGRFPLAANGRALILNHGKGLVKVLIGDALGEILGVHILGPGATELIGEAAIAIGLEATAEEIIETIHAHPTVTEALREAVLAGEKRAIHSKNR